MQKVPSTDGTPDKSSSSRTPFWVDLLNPTSDEVGRVANECGLQIPSREALQEIEASSRLRSEGHVLYLSMPLALHEEKAGFAPVPLGFILSPDILITIRFSAVHSIDQLKARLETEPPADSATVFAALIETIVDYSADQLEMLRVGLRRFRKKFSAPRKRCCRMTSASPGRCGRVCRQ